jgi:beta-galactosidase
VTYVGVETLSGDLEKDIVAQVLKGAGATVEDFPNLFFVDWRDGFWVASNFSSTDQRAPVPAGVRPLVGTAVVPPAGVTIWKE